MYTGSVLMIFKQYTLNGKRRVSNGKRHVIQRKQTRENVCGLCLNANSCNFWNTVMTKIIFVFDISLINHPMLQPASGLTKISAASHSNIINLLDIV